MESKFVDEIDCTNFFDQIDDLIEFPPENDGRDRDGGGDLVGSGDFPSMWSNDLPEFDPLFSGSHGDSMSDLSAELSVPYEDIVQLEWLSTFVEDSFSGRGLTLGKENVCVNKEPSHNQFQTSSPISVLESSSSSSEKTVPISPTRGPQRARSKRPRPTSFNPRAAMQLISPSSSLTENPELPLVTAGLSLESENFAESQPTKKIRKPGGEEKKKRKKNKINSSPNPMETMPDNPPAQAVRKCLHCEITKTPQWRAGPMGPKTLCNACGVRYKSGRLFPEYRPAASPTFVPSLHSNSHKKVVEMRSKVGPGTIATSPTSTEPGTKVVPNP